MCYNPRTLANPNKHRPGEMWHIQVPCGICASCFNKRADDWMIRLHYELKIHLYARFVTLTYENPPRTFNGLFTTCMEDLQAYFKRLRKREKGNHCIKYYAVSEYGEMHQRPHYHIIAFGVKDPNNFIRAWAYQDIAATQKLRRELCDVNAEVLNPIGLVHLGDERGVSQASIRYVTGYIGKKIGIPLTDYDDRERERSIMSKNMGLYYMDNVSQFNRENMVGYTVLDGKKYNLPRYYKNKIFNDYERTKISKANYDYYLKHKSQEIKNFGSERAWEKNQFELAMRDVKNKQAFINSQF